MRVSLIGSVLMLCTPIFSVIVVTLLLPLMHWYLLYLPPYQPVEPGIAWNLSTITLLAIGIGLYFYGSLKHEQQTSTEAEMIFGLGIILALYGLFTNFLAIAYQIDAAPRLTPPDMATYNSFIETWLLKGSLWVVTGVALIAQALIKYEIYRNRAREKSLD